MNSIVRNFIFVISRFKMASFLNVAGLSVAFTAFLILFMQIRYEWGYDRFHKHADRLYRLEIVFNNTGAQVVLNRPLIDRFLASSPHIEEGALINQWGDKIYITVDRDGERMTFQEKFCVCYPSYARVFDFDMVEGEAAALEEKGRVLIPASMAHRFFGDHPAVGQVLIGEGWTSEVGGVYRDFPSNSIVSNAVYRRISDKEGAGAWMQNNFECYLRLDDPASAPDVLAGFKKNFRHDGWNWKTRQLRLTALPDIYFKTDTSYDSQKQKGSYAQLQALSAIAILIVLIAVINFMNFSNALVPVRLRGINTRKVLGSPVSALRMAVASEAVGMCLLSYLIALLLVRLLSKTGFVDLVSGGISLEGQMPLLIACGGFVLLIGLIAGCWPAWYITSFSPALVLKGNFGLSPKGRSFRNVLVGFQFVASFILVIAALFITWQNYNMLHTPLGFDSERIVTVKLNRNLSRQPESVRQRLGQLSSVEALSFTSRVLGAEDNYSGWGRTYVDEDIQFKVVQADSEIERVLALPILEGRGFLPEDQLSDGTYLFNEEAKRTYGLKAGDPIRLDWGDLHRREKIAGFVPDLKYNSFRDKLEPFAIFVGKDIMAGALTNLMILVRPGTDYRQLSQDIGSTLRELDPDYPLDIHLFNNIQENLYQKELLLGKQILFFSLIAVFVSLVGVFGVVLFESEYKRKEIGIRKVFGATVMDLLRKHNLSYLWIVMICFVIASPIAWYGIERWQENFALKAPLHWWIFLLAFLAITIITLLTVTIQNYRAASTNPVDSIRQGC